jgi:hypothetical protein
MRILGEIACGFWRSGLALQNEGSEQRIATRGGLALGPLFAKPIEKTQRRKPLANFDFGFF